SPGASAVSLAQVRLALRTTRGRSILLSPLIMVAIFAAVMSRNASRMNLGAFDLTGGLGLAVFGTFVCLVATLPFAMNQFAVDRAGCTLALLPPLSDREYLKGKAVGNALIAVPPALLCVAASWMLFPGGPWPFWLAIPIGIVATCLVVSPVAAILSALFPRVV